MALKFSLISCEKCRFLKSHRFFHLQHFYVNTDSIYKQGRYMKLEVR